MLSKETKQKIKNAIQNYCEGVEWLEFNVNDLDNMANDIEAIVEAKDPFDELFEPEPEKVEYIEMTSDEFNKLVEKHYGGSFEFEAIEEADRAVYPYEIDEKGASLTFNFGGECEKIRAGKYPTYCTYHVFKCLFEDGHIKAGKYLIDNRN